MIAHGLLRAALLGASLAAASAAGAAPTEWWVVCGRFEGGHTLALELTITDVGPGERNAAAVGSWIAPNGVVTPFRKARASGGWQSAGTRLTLDDIVFDRASPRATLRADKRRIHLELGFPLGAQPIARHDFAGGAWHQELWASAAPAHASVRLEGTAAPLELSGVVAMSHRSIAGAESELALRRFEAFSLASRTRLYVAEVASARRSERWTLAERDGAIFSESFERSPAAPVGKGVPARIELAGERARGRFEAGRELVAYDPLAELPGPVRFLVSLAIRLRSAWMASPFDVTVRGASSGLRLRGTAIASYTFYGQGD